MPGWTSPCLKKYRTYLAETGWTSPLPGGGLVEALPLPQTKQSSARACEAAQASIALDVLTPCKAQAALPNQPSLAWFGWLLAIRFGWLLAGLAETVWLDLPAAALWRHCPSHKRSKVDGAIPRVGLRSSPGVDLASSREKGCTSLTPCKAALPNQASACLIGHPPAWKISLPG